MRKVEWAISNLETCIEKARKKLKVEEREEQRNKWQEGMSEIERDELDAFLEDIDGSCCSTYSREEYLDELNRVLYALRNIDPNENVVWVSEDKMAEICEDHIVEEYFSNNAAIIMECNNYHRHQKVWLICLIKRN